ncbi:hypothetical protein LSH36_46g07046 [Paralvinella palmiformis]|uniref:TGF-beta family profile domain-containing protein n=1 Tax=Paralvinella palmiformis TaxID=53620 RepID=A0AAD9NFX4_9ANNE|nr:hypothetical protein LSH36_46g07046 [Paralvinella palmiformis]
MTFAMTSQAAALRLGIVAQVLASIVMVTVYGRRTVTPSVEGYTEEALERLSQVFGIGKVPKLHKAKTAPEYMMELYKSVAFSDGITRQANPYDADVVRGFPDRAPRQQTHYYFNVSFIDKSEDILAAEVRLYKLKPEYSDKLASRRHATKHPHTVLLQLYQVLTEHWQLDRDSLKLLDQRRIGAHSTGWQVFTVTDTIKQWVNDTRSNHDQQLPNLGHSKPIIPLHIERRMLPMKATLHDVLRKIYSGNVELFIICGSFLIRASAPDGTSVNGSYIRFAQRTQHHESKQPILVVFSGDMLPTYVLSNRKKKGSPPAMESSQNASISDQRTGSNNLESVRRSYILYLNEEYRSKNGDTFPYDRYRAYMTQSEHERLLAESRRARLVHERRRRTKDRQRRTSKHPPRRPFERQSKGARERHDDGTRTRRSTDYYRPSRRKHKACQRNELYVDFSEIGWSGWIISPKGYNAYHCWGECPFPLGQYYRPTNHATVQSIVYTMRIEKNVRLPCCVPDKLYSISLLYFDDEENVILKQYDEMVAASCGCH